MVLASISRALNTTLRVTSVFGTQHPESQDADHVGCGQNWSHIVFIFIEILKDTPPVGIQFGNITVLNRGTGRYFAKTYKAWEAVVAENYHAHVVHHGVTFECYITFEKATGRPT